MGDNADLFPFDAEARYDSDGDGIANAHDPFPENKNMDSWFDLILRIMIIGGILGGGVLLFQRQKSDAEIESMDSFEQQTELFMVEENHIQRPSAPPSPDAFQTKE